MKTDSLAALLRSTAATSALALSGIALCAAPAIAQTTQQTQSEDPPVSDEGGDIVVTGSLFSRADTATPSPVTVINAETLERAGVTNMADAIRQASADGAGSIGIGFTSGFSAGGSAVSLRNLGVSSTLVLVDGLRSANFPLSDDGHNSYVDLASIPQVNVERVEVLKDGASSTYGADAIGGVVNIITRRQFVGIQGGVEAGVSEKGDGQKYRARLLAGFGDYDSRGWNIYVGGEYEKGGTITADSRGFPFNTLDLRAIGGVDSNRADDTLGTATPDAVVTRVTQTDLNNPLAGSVANATTPAIFNSLTPLANCQFGTYSENTAARVGTACAHNMTREYVQILPKQERYAGVARFSFRVSDAIQGYVAGSYSNNKVDITLPPRAIRQNQAFGGSPATSTTNPGIVLPYFICSSGVNCATAADRKLNPNNPYATNLAATPAIAAANAARLYYLFGDVKAGSERTNELYRVTAGLRGTIGDSWKWNIDAGYSRDDLELIQTGFANLNGLVRAINTGSYNFVNPSLNSQAVRDSVVPPITSLSNSQETTVDASLSRSLFALPGGDLQVAVGAQYRKEKLTNRSANPNLDVPGLSTAQAYGNRDVWAGYFEINAPILDSLEVNASGRYDDYSEGFGRFSPKIGAKFSPIEQISLRGTFSKGFRAPTFAEINPLSSYSGFVGFNPSTSPDAVAFRQAHAANAAYTANYSLGRGYVGNPGIKPEKSRSFTLGAVFEPSRNVSFTVDYFNVKKSDLIVTGPQTGDAIRAYYSVAGQTFASAAAASAAGCAQVAAIPGYSCNVVDGADPFALNALPRLLVVNAPYVNANYDVTTGLQFGANGRFDISEDVRFETRLDLQATLKFDRHLDNGNVQHFTGTVGPADLSSGGGTPKWRGNWQNTLIMGPVSLTATTYYVGRMKGVATDQGNLDTSCAATIYKDATGGNSFCKINRFIYADLNATIKVNDQFSFFMFVGNFTNAGAPVYANTLYTTQPNYLASWHLPGLIGRTFRAGANFKF
ncbi:TonB-dependent receptor plug domain-containing protein [Sphingomonas sp. ZT3P38]|uniref:TonB-dependent receptor plug domain-containing protein n=1 Tax=Parasphingomonas zepuensis TaxID=3096161 RepID=UPI003FA79293